jgi:hypothetical protein
MSESVRTAVKSTPPCAARHHVSRMDGQAIFASATTALRIQAAAQLQGSWPVEAVLYILLADT